MRISEIFHSFVEVLLSKVTTLYRYPPLLVKRFSKNL